jgi:hypothetical protein
MYQPINLACVGSLIINPKGIVRMQQGVDGSRKVLADRITGGNKIANTTAIDVFDWLS